MTESRSSKRRFFGFNFFDFILVIAIITMIIMAVVAKNFSPQTIQEVLISLGILSIAMLITSILYRLYKARPDLFYRDQDGNLRFKSPRDRFEYDEKEPESPYDSVTSDSYQYKSRGYGKKPFTDFCLEETTTCSICKLKIDKNEKIYRCPECRSPFHIEHLADWLNENSDCPVCNVELSL